MPKKKVYPGLASSVAMEAARDPRSIESKRPKEVALALELLGHGKSFVAVAKETGIGMNTIAALRERHGVALEEHRSRFAADGVEMAEKLRLLANQKLQQLADNPDQLAETNIRDIVVPYAIVQDKVFSALGENKVVVEHRKEGVSLEEARVAIEEARKKALEEKKAESIDVEANGE